MPEVQRDGGLEAKKEKKPRRTGQAKSQASRSAASKTKPKTKTKAKTQIQEKAIPRLTQLYKDEIVPSLMKEFKFQSPMEVPRIKKVVLNVSLGEALTNSRAIESAVRDLTTMTGQKPVVTRARKSIAGFKLRAGVAIGTAVTLRGRRMMYFLERLFNAALPRIRDFNGIPRSSFDGQGNFTIGIREQIIFPEIDYDSIDRIRGFQVTIATTAKDDRQAERLLEMMGVPFARQN
jgi:large subunit ribosomal protein L5